MKATSQRNHFGVPRSTHFSQTCSPSTQFIRRCRVSSFLGMFVVRCHGLGCYGCHWFGRWIFVGTTETISQRSSALKHQSQVPAMPWESRRSPPRRPEEAVSGPSFNTLARTPSIPLCQRGTPGSCWNWGIPLILRRVYDQAPGIRLRRTAPLHTIGGSCQGVMNHAPTGSLTESRRETSRTSLETTSEYVLPGP
jgi:hypothetical protein